MKHGYMVITLRLSSSRRSGSRLIHRGRKKRIKFPAMSSVRWSFFFDIQGILHKEFAPPGQTVNGKFYCELLKRLREGIWHKRPDNTPAHTSLVVRQFLTSKNITVIPHPTIRLTSPQRPFPIPQGEITAERASFWHDWGDPRRITRGYRHTHIWELPGMHEIMGNKLGSLYICPRGLFQRRRWILKVTVRNFFMVKFPEFLGSTSYIFKAKLIFVPQDWWWIFGNQVFLRPNLSSARNQRENLSTNANPFSG